MVEKVSRRGRRGMVPTGFIKVSTQDKRSMGGETRNDEVIRCVPCAAVMRYETFNYLKFELAKVRPPFRVAGHYYLPRLRTF